MKKGELERMFDIVRKRVEEIEKCAGDDEIAHGLEDDLHKDVLEWIAKEAPSPFNEIAREALKTLDLEFYRWTG